MEGATEVKTTGFAKAIVERLVTSEPASLCAASQGHNSRGFGVYWARICSTRRGSDSR